MKSVSDMTMMVFSYWGMFAVQTVLHSLIASVLSYCALLAWNVKTPEVKQRFQFMVIFLPVVSFPLYQLFFPRRGDVFFRLDSLMDSNRWFLIDIFGSVPVLAVFLSVLALTAAVFLFQEFVPIVFHLFRQAHDAGTDDEGVDEAAALKVSESLEGLPFPRSSVEILNDDDYILFSTTGISPKIYVSTGLISSFHREHLRASLAHEIGHIRRSRKPVILIAYILRMLMFYNPVAMIQFRRLAQEEEKVCDDLAISMTGSPEALAEAIDMLRDETESEKAMAKTGRVEGIIARVEHHSHHVVLKNRELRIRQERRDDSPWLAPFFVTLALIIGLNFFIV